LQGAEDQIGRPFDAESRLHGGGDIDLGQDSEALCLERGLDDRASLDRHRDGRAERV
jgi:hypothetical protein